MKSNTLAKGFLLLAAIATVSIVSTDQAQSSITFSPSTLNPQQISSVSYLVPTNSLDFLYGSTNLLDWSVIAILDNETTANITSWTNVASLDSTYAHQG